jgi:L-threonylcarbamoyladenylate synthase
MQTKYFKDYLDIDYINKILKNDAVIAFPTETVYGLGAFISKDKAIEKIYKLKKRPPEKALTVHLGNLDQVHLVAENIPEIFFVLANKFLPGPLTIILKKKKSISPWVSSLDTVAVRIPSHPLTLTLLKGLDEPIVGTSANISSEKSPISAQEIKSNFLNQIECIIDGGQCDIGIPSTVITLVDEIKILRKGFITKNQIEKTLNIKI